MSTPLSDTRLFQPITIAKLQIPHRIFMSSLTRYRNNDSNIPTPLMKEYYTQRASTPGTLIFSEATSPSQRTAGLHANQPGIWSDAQIAAWREITDAVHEKGCFMICQLFAAGRAAVKEVMDGKGLPVKGPSAIGIDDGVHVVPEEMTKKDITNAIEDFVQGAYLAVDRAGFDGIEIHNAYGTLTDQFCHSSANQRADDWGGSIERRSKFTLDLTKAVIAAVGKDKVGIRFSPYSTYLGMQMYDPLPQFTYLVSELRRLGLGWLHLVEPRMDGIFDVVRAGTIRPLIETWGHQGAVIVNGGYTADNVRKALEEEYREFNVAVSFGRWFIANPDLVERLKDGRELNGYNRDTFYKPKVAEGYVDYPFLQK